jgi:hypothetical protein
MTARSSRRESTIAPCTTPVSRDIRRAALRFPPRLHDRSGKKNNHARRRLAFLHRHNGRPRKALQLHLHALEANPQPFIDGVDSGRSLHRLWLRPWHCEGALPRSRAGCREHGWRCSYHAVPYASSINQMSTLNEK